MAEKQIAEKRSAEKQKSSEFEKLNRWEME